jgi:ribosomal protein L19
MGDELIPTDITNLMGCEPTRSYKKGDIKIGKVTGTERIKKSGMWLLEATIAEPENIDGQIEEILSKLTQDFSIWQTLSKKFTIDIFCGLFMEESNEGLSLSLKTLSALGDRGIEIGFDIYSPSVS